MLLSLSLLSNFVGIVCPSLPTGNFLSVAMPILLISVPNGVWYFATVTLTAEPSLSGTMVWIKPLPYVGSSPKMVARLLSRKAAVKTSEADGAFVDNYREFLL